MCLVRKTKQNVLSEKLLKLSYLSAAAAAQNFLDLQGFHLLHCFSLLLEKWKKEFQDVLNS